MTIPNIIHELTRYDEPIEWAKQEAITILERVERLEQKLEVLSAPVQNTEPLNATHLDIYRLEFWAKDALKYLRTGEEW